MGVREEVERLAPRKGYDLDTSLYGRAITDVLRILDEHLGECVTEYEFGVVGVLKLVLKDETKRLITGLPGDRIAIYRRKQ